MNTTRGAARPLSVIAATVVGSALLLLPTQASAAYNWDTSVNIHNSKLQVCKTWVRPGTWTVRLRLNNRAASHSHRGVVGVRHNGTWVMRTVDAAAGRISDVKALTYRRGDTYSDGIADHAGGSRDDISWMNRC